MRRRFILPILVAFAVTVHRRAIVERRIVEQHQLHAGGELAVEDGEIGAAERQRRETPSHQQAARLEARVARQS